MAIGNECSSYNNQDLDSLPIVFSAVRVETELRTDILLLEKLARLGEQSLKWVRNCLAHSGRDNQWFSLRLAACHKGGSSGINVPHLHRYSGQCHLTKRLRQAERVGLARTVWGAAETSAQSCPWGDITKGPSTGCDLHVWGAALLKETLESRGQSLESLGGHCSYGGKSNPGLQLQGTEGQSSAHHTLNRACWAAPEASRLFLVLTSQGRHKNKQRPAESWKAEEAMPFQEKRKENLIGVFQYLKGIYKGYRVPLFTRSHMANGG